MRACTTARLVSSDPVIPAGKPEVVLDPARFARLPTERGALDDQRLEALGGAVDGGAEAGRAGSDDEQVDLFAGRELASDAERPRQLAGDGACISTPPGRRTSGRLEGSRPATSAAASGSSAELRIAPGERQPVAADELEQPHRRRERVRADDLEPEPGDLLQRLAARDERREHEDAERPVVEQQRAQGFPIDGDVAQRLS